MATKTTNNMTKSHKAGYRMMIGYIQTSAVQRLDLGTPETIFPVRSMSGSVPVYIDPTCANGLANERHERASQNGCQPRQVRAIVHANEIWSGGAKLAIATTDAIAKEIAEALNLREA